jgi:hypothetical protein
MQKAAAAETTKPVSEKAPSKLASLLEKKAALDKQIAAAQAHESAKARTEDTRLKIIVGAAILADMKIHPETRAGVVEILQKAVTAPRDREFLTSKGLL